MQRVQKLYSQLPTPHKIGAAVMANLLLMILVISAALLFEYGDIRKSQLQLPDQFFRKYQRESLAQVGHKLKHLILSGVGYRISWITNVRNLMVMRIGQNSTDGEELLGGVCVFTDRANSMFNCSKDLYVRSAIVEYFAKANPARNFDKAFRRINLIYVSNKNPKDVMAFSYARDNDFAIKNITEIHEKIRNIQEGFTSFSSFQRDTYGKSSGELVSFHCKVTQPDYTVLIEMQTYGLFITNSITRVIYSDQLNVLVLVRNDQDPQGFMQVSALSAPDPDIDYRQLLEPGHKELIVRGNPIYAYSLKMSSVYRTGSFHNVRNRQIDNKYTIIIQVPNINIGAENAVYGFIDNLHAKLGEFLLVFAICMVALVGSNTSRLCFEIGRRIEIISSSMRQYFSRPEAYYQVLNSLLAQSEQEYWFGSIMRGIYEIIRVIEHGKRRFMKKSQKPGQDYFPLNMLQQKFMASQRIMDMEQFQALKQAVSERQKDQES